MYVRSEVLATDANLNVKNSPVRKNNSLRNERFPKGADFVKKINIPEPLYARPKSLLNNSDHLYE